MSKRVTVSVSVVFGLALVAATVEISTALALRCAIATSPQAEKSVEHMGTQYNWKDWMLHHVAPNQLGPLRAWLLESSSSTLRGAQYAIAGLGGGVFAYWLWLLGVRPGDGERMARPLLRILAGGVAGLLVMLVLRLPAPLLARWPAFSLAPPPRRRPRSWLPQPVLKRSECNCAWCTGRAWIPFATRCASV